METISSTCQESQPCWIERTFQRRDCIRFIPSNRVPDRCFCGLEAFDHDPHQLSSLPDLENDQQSPVSSFDEHHWNPLRHSVTSPTNAFGTIEFQGASHSLKARYVRVSFDTRPELLLQLITREWRLELPKLVISVHGGKANFKLQPKLKKILQVGLIRAAKTTGAWIITAGTNTGIMRHVGEAIGHDRSPCLRNRVVTFGIAPWGIVENRERLLGHNVVVPYYSISSPKSKFSELNSHHSYFILADNGTVGRYGAEIALRKKLERYISKQQIYSRGDNRCAVPVVCVLIEGGVNSIRTVLEYVTDTPPVPVVICDGSGRSADLLAFAHKYIGTDEFTPSEIRQSLMEKIEQTFQLGREQSEQLYIELVQCVRRSDLITVFRMGEEPYQDLDQAILTALLKGHHLSKTDQLNLALNWDRIDIAKSDIFVYGVEWPKGSLEQALMDALVLDRVEFVHALLENGVSMQRFLTVARLEELYNTKYGPANTLQYVVRDVKKHMPRGYRYQLYDIGLVVEKLMGGAYRSQYCTRKFRQLYIATSKKSVKSIYSRSPDLDVPFLYPFNELLIWAVLTMRQKMALFMWKQGKEAVVRALVALNLYKSMAKEAEDDDLEEEICFSMLENAREFETLSLEVLDYCYRQDDDQTFHLLTHELTNWSKQTCLGLAVMGRHHAFLAHTASQVLVADLWMGGLRIRKTTNLKVILGLLLPPTILRLRFKTKEELRLMPQTEAEHQLELDDDNKSIEDTDTSSKAESTSENGSINQSVKMSKVKNGKVFLFESTAEMDCLDSSLPPKSRPLSLGKKIYEFYAAPITKFWSHVLAYFLFLLAFTYAVLVKTPSYPHWTEIYTIFYNFTILLEKTREIVSSEPDKLRAKLMVWAEKKWNPCDLGVVLFFFVGVVLRWDEHNIPVARIFYCLSIMYWYLRMLDMLSVNKYLGPYVTMIGKMTMNMIYFVVLLLVVLMSYGVGRQGIFYPNEEPSWQLVRNIFFMPYWMLYGEVFADTIDPECGEGKDLECQTGMWINPAIMATYLLVANILLVNLLIAVFNNIFYEVSVVSRQLWKSQRYRVVIEYEQKPVFPPPLIIISHIVFLLRFCTKTWKGKPNTFDHGLKLFLSETDVEKIHDFEEECIEGYLNESEEKVGRSMEEQIKLTTERVDAITEKVQDIYSQELHNENNVENVKYELSKMQELLSQMITTQTVTQHMIASYPKNVLSHGVSMEIELASFDELHSDVKDKKQDDDLKMSSNEMNHPEASEVVDEATPLPLTRIASTRQRSLKQKKTSKITLPKSRDENEDSSTRGRSLTDVKALAHTSHGKISRSNSAMTVPKITLTLPVGVVSPSPRLLRPTRMEYTSITNDLESSGIITSEPPYSRQASRQMSQPLEFDQEQAIAIETAILRGAEEADYHLMEGLIQRRLRRESQNLDLSLEDLGSLEDTDSEDERELEELQDILIRPPHVVSSEIVLNPADVGGSSEFLHPDWTES